MNLTPDGVRYAVMGSGQRAPRPFHLRWLIPFLCKDKAWRWRACAYTSAVAATVGVYGLAWHYGAGWRAATAAGLLWAGLPSVRFAWRFPVLIDLPTVAVSVCAALLYLHNPTLGLVAALVAGCVNERCPIFVALFAWSPLPLVGLVAPLIRLAWRAGPDPLPDQAVLDHPFKASMASHAGRWRDPLLMVVPWGGCLVALGALDVQLAVALAFGYTQLLIATDSVRLYQQVAPIVCVLAVLAVPVWALPALVVVTWFNPLTGNGV